MSPLRRPLLAALVLLALSACARKDARLEQLSAGISKDSVIAVMSGDQPHHVAPYLVSGHYIETLYFAKPGSGTDSASLADRNLSPAVLVDGKLAGWGWKMWDSIAGANKITVDPK